MKKISYNYVFACSTLAVSLLVLDGVSGQNVSDQSRESIAPLQLIVSTAKTNFRAGERIELLIVVTNTSMKRVDFAASNMPETDYQHRVVGGDQKETPLTREGTNLLSAHFYDFRTVQLLPGQSFTNVIILNQIYDVTLPQEYEVSVSKGPHKAKPVRFSVRAF